MNFRKRCRQISAFLPKDTFSYSISHFQSNHSNVVHIKYTIELFCVFASLLQLHEFRLSSQFMCWRVLVYIIKRNMLAFRSTSENAEQFATNSFPSSSSSMCSPTQMFVGIFIFFYPSRLFLQSVLLPCVYIIKYHVLPVDC